MLLSDTICLVTGASGGIGSAICRLFAEQGARLILTGRSKSALEELAQDLPRFSGSHLVYVLDVTSETEVKYVFQQLNEQELFINCLINNAGVMEDSILQLAKSEMIHRVFDINVLGTIFPTQQAIKAFLRNRRGTVINLSSIVGVNGSSGQSIYSSSKSAVIGFTKSLSKELASLNIRVNAIAPGFIDTKLTMGRDAKFYERNINSIGMKRFGNPEEVAKVALFLASDLSSYVTGQIIGVNGGMII